MLLESKFKNRIKEVRTKLREELKEAELQLEAAKTVKVGQPLIDKLQQIVDMRKERTKSHLEWFKEGLELDPPK